MIPKAKGKSKPELLNGSYLLRKVVLIIVWEINCYFFIIVCKWVPVFLPFWSHPCTPWPSLLPYFKIFVSPPLFSVPPPFKVFQTVPPTFMQIPPPLIWPTNLSWFKQISKGQIYQFNCRFLSKINFNLLNPFTTLMKKLANV